MTKNTTKAMKSKAAANTRATKPVSRATANKATNARKPAEEATRANHTPCSPTAPVRRAKKVPKLSAMKAAVQVLAKSPEEGMRTKDMVEAMDKQGLWTSPAGKTPEATLYAGITREIAKKGNEARFRKVSKGRFTLN